MKCPELPPLNLKFSNSAMNDLGEKSMRILGLDVGDKTIGIAVSDDLGFSAHPVTIIRRKNIRLDLEKIGSLIAEYEVSEILVGLPKSLNNSIGPQAEKVLKFVEVIKKTFPDLPLRTWDERFSTVEAERVLLEADLSRKRRKGLIDKVAASFILQGYLDWKSHQKKNNEQNQTYIPFRK